MSSLGRLPDTLPFTKADLRLPVAVRKSRRNSISGVQSKVLLSIVDGEFAVVESGGDFILKPVPDDSLSRFAADIPANENADFVALGKFYGLGENAVRGILGECKIRRPQVESMVRDSLLSEEAKEEYLRIFADRLCMFR